jgi:hypothetical protein
MNTCDEQDCPRVIYKRDLCRKHYDQKYNPGTRADKAYRRWLFSTPRVSAELVRPWVEIVLAMPGVDGSCEAAGRVTGVDSEVLRRILKGVAKNVTALTAEDLAVATGRMVELALALPDTGVEGWSEYGRYCGDGCPIGHGGCGSWFHSSSLYGLCVECCAIALGLSGQDTRDVRFTREREEVEA